MQESKSNISIRNAQPGEGETLASIEAACFPAAEAASVEAIKERLAAFPEKFFVAETGKSSGICQRRRDR